MKPIVKRILESGLVDKHTALLMEKWRSVDDGAAELVGKGDLRKISEAALLQFAEEIEEMVEGERTSLRETKLSINVQEPALVRWVLVRDSEGLDRETFGSQFPVFRDEMGNFIFPPFQPISPQSGNRFRSSDGAVWEVRDATELHVGDQRYAIQVEAIKVDLG